MIINDKALIAAMKKAYNGEGYELAITDDTITISAKEFVVRCKLKFLVRRIRAQIVLHIGFWPQKGCYAISKKHVQQSVLALFEETVAGIINETDTGLLYYPTPLTLNDLVLWQHPTERTILALKPWQIAMVGANGLYVAEASENGKYIRFHGEASEIVLTAEGRDNINGWCLSCLQSHKWTSEGRDE